MYIFQKQPIELISPPKSFGRAVQRNYPTSYSNLLLEFPKGLQKYQVKLCNLHFKNRICEPNHVAMKPIFQSLLKTIFAPRLIVEDGGAIHILGEAQDSRPRTFSASKSHGQIECGAYRNRGMPNTNIQHCWLESPEIFRIIFSS